MSKVAVSSVRPVTNIQMKICQSFFSKINRDTS